jgi:phosphoglycerol transferase
MPEALPAAVRAPLGPGGQREPLTEPSLALWRAAKGLAGYLAVLAACLLILTWSLKLWRANLSVPLAFYGDPIFHLMTIKGTLDHGWYLHNPSLGVPFGVDLHDFPMADPLHFLMLKLLGLLCGDVFITFNLYYLLTFPLTAATALFALRRLHVSYPAAAVGALLFTFLPYHLLRIVHLHLAAYYVIPLTVLVVMRVHLGRLTLFRSRRLLSWEGLGAVAVCVLTGMSGGYYAFFACFLLAVAALAAASFQRRLAPLGVAAVLIAVVVGTVGVALYPTLRYRREHGPNSLAEDARRSPGEAEHFGLKPVQLVLPVPGHRCAPLSRLRLRYAGAPLANENEFSSLGAVGSVGFVWLLGRLLFRRRSARQIKLLDALAVLTAAALLLATVGGLGSLFALLVTPVLRCYNRMSVYLGFFALAAVAVGLDRVVRRFATSRVRAGACWSFLGGLLALGGLDQTSAGYVPAYGPLRQEARVLREFVGRVEASLPAGSWVYQLPYAMFPSGARPGQMFDYDHFRPYLYSRSLCWSYGAMHGRDGDAWLQHVAEQPLQEQVKLVSAVGFRGLYLDRAGFEDRAAQAEAELRRLLGTEPVVSADGRMSFFPLAAYAEGLRRQYTDAGWEALRRRALQPITFLWRNGFYPREQNARETWNWSNGKGELAIRNPSGSPRTITLAMNCLLPQPQPALLHIRSSLFNLDCPIDWRAPLVEKTLVVPPGEHVVRFTCDGPRVVCPTDTRELVFRIVNFKCRQEE